MSAAARGKSRSPEHCAALAKAKLGKKRGPYRVGRWRASGELNTQSKLTERDVREIKALLRTNMTQRAIAKLYRVNPSHITKIKLGKAWGHVSDVKS
jgi:hypothetical protein